MISKPTVMKDDPIGFLFKFYQLVCSFKSSIILLFGSCSVAMTLSAVSSFYLWKDYGFKFLKHNSLSIFLSPWLVATMITQFFFVRPKLKGIIREEFWNVESVSKSMRLRILKIVKIKRIEFVIYLLLCVMAGFVLSLIGHLKGHNVYPEVTYVQEYYGGSQLSKILIYALIYIAHQIITFYSVALFILLKYSVISVQLQLYILADYLLKANVYKDGEVFYIREHLRVCAIHHISVLRWYKVVQDVCFLPILYMIVCGQLVLVCCSIFMYYNRHYMVILQVGSILFLSYLLAMDFCQCGQDANNAFEELQMNLCKLKWYDWDEVNKKIVMIMLHRTQRVETIRTLGLSVDRTLMVTIMKLAYQGCLIFLRIAG